MERGLASAELAAGRRKADDLQRKSVGVLATLRRRLLVRDAAAGTGRRRPAIGPQRM
jgi:hypothetical protein